MEWLEDSITIMGSPVLYMDIMALAWFALAWFGYGQFADANYRRRLNLIRIMDDMRTRWMHQILKRDSRISDATLVGNIVRSILFYASTSILVLLGLFTVMGSQTAGLTVLRAIPFAVGATPLMFDVKISLMVLIFIYVFFKLSWSVRQYNYVNIIIGAAPMPHEGKHHHFDYAERAGKLVGNAGRHFNMADKLAVQDGLQRGAGFLLFAVQRPQDGIGRDLVGEQPNPPAAIEQDVSPMGHFNPAAGKSLVVISAPKQGHALCQPQSPAQLNEGLAGLFLQPLHLLFRQMLFLRRFEELHIGIQPGQQTVQQAVALLVGGEHVLPPPVRLPEG